MPDARPAHGPALRSCRTQKIIERSGAGTGFSRSALSQQERLAPAALAWSVRLASSIPALHEASRHPPARPPPPASASSRRLRPSDPALGLSHPGHGRADLRRAASRRALAEELTTVELHCDQALDEGGHHSPTGATCPVRPAARATSRLRLPSTTPSATADRQRTAFFRDTRARHSISTCG
jgi:hypothetical protein